MPDFEYPVRADAYRNLRAGGLSIRDRRTDSDTYGEVIDHVDRIVIDDAEVVVYAGKRQLVADGGSKNVHAMFRGTSHVPSDEEYFHPMKAPQRIGYDVDTETCFHVDGEAIVGADRVVIDTRDGATNIAGVGIDLHQN